MIPSFGNRIRKVYALVAAALILPALAYAQNNQGNGGPGFNLGIPNGTYVYNITGFFPSGASVAAVTRDTYTPNATGSGGTTRGVASYSVFGAPMIFIGVPFKGTFTVNADGSVSESDTQAQTGTVHNFTLYPTPDANTMTVIQIDPGNVASGVGIRGR